MKNTKNPPKPHIMDFQRAFYIKRINRIFDVWFASSPVEFLKQLAHAAESVEEGRIVATGRRRYLFAPRSRELIAQPRDNTKSAVHQTISSTTKLA